jgi:dolichyl-phosphate beta-glucosyltransferase
VTDVITLSYVVCAYNEATALPRTVKAVTTRLQRHPGSELIVVENGSTDGTYEIACDLAAEYSTAAVEVRVARTGKGQGKALREGIRLARADVVVLTAADLPFEFTDLDAMLALNTRAPVVLGSKAHPRSVADTGLKRRTMSAGFRMIRSALLRLHVRDSQGSAMIDRRLIQGLLPYLRADGYLITTEIAAFAARAGYRPVEVPVQYVNPRADSKVRPVQDSWAMLRSTWELRRRLSAPAPAPSAAPSSRLALESTA